MKEGAAPWKAIVNTVVVRPGFGAGAKSSSGVGRERGLLSGFRQQYEAVPGETQTAGKEEKQ